MPDPVKRNTLYNAGAAEGIAARNVGKATEVQQIGKLGAARITTQIAAGAVDGE